MRLGWWLIIGAVVLFIILIIIGKLIEMAEPKNKICAWCNSTEISFISGSGEQGSWFWNYRNKDGTKDKRAKDNAQLAAFRSKYECDKCSAVTAFNHYVDPEPDRFVKVYSRELVVKGKGEREGTDWKDSKAIDIDSSKAYRKWMD